MGQSSHYAGFGHNVKENPVIRHGVNPVSPGSQPICRTTPLSFVSVFRWVKSSRNQRLTWVLGDGWDGSWDGLGRTLGRIKCAKSSMFIGLGTVGRINWGEKGKHQTSAFAGKLRPGKQSGGQSVVGTGCNGQIQYFRYVGELTDNVTY